MTRQTEAADQPLPDSARLEFEPLRADHAAGLFESLSDPRVHEHLGQRPPATVAELALQFARKLAGPPPHLARERWINHVVRLRTCATLIGRLEATVVESRAEVAYLLGPQHWGQGYALEAMLAFQVHLAQSWGVREFWATTSPHNARSISLLRRLAYTEASAPHPSLGSYDSGDLVFVLRQHKASSQAL